MKSALNIAEIKVVINFSDQTEKAVLLCRRFFKGFIQSDQKVDAEAELTVFKKPVNGRYIGKIAGRGVFEKLIPVQNVAEWLKDIPGYNIDFPMNEKTICSFCVNGLLLFDPETSGGCIYLLEEGDDCFRPLYRLIWMYLSQVLGEKGGCFVHAAALVKHGEGRLFMGGSGSGKSSLARKLGQRYHVFSDDGPILFSRNGECRLYPSPYHQMDHLTGLDKEVLTMSAGLKALYFLVKDKQVFLDKVSGKEAFSMILLQYIHFFPYLSAGAKVALFDLFFDACYKIPAYYFHFRLDRDLSEIIDS
jgi:hypothetical protein